MDDPAAPIAAALKIMRQWDWQRYNPDGFPFPPGKDLSFVVNRLALEGVSKPDEVVLELLCSGELVARADFYWRKYQHGQSYQFEGLNEKVASSRWQGLAKAIADEIQSLTEPGRTCFETDLKNLGMKECPTYEWVFGDNRFSTAFCPPDTDTWALTYLEEWFSAWNIDVFLPDAEPQIGDDGPAAEAAPLPPNINKGGRPPAADWEMAALEMAGRYYRGDLKPQTIADVSRALTAWLGDQDLHPSDSVIRHHAKRIFDAFKAWEQE